MIDNLAAPNSEPFTKEDTAVLADGEARSLFQVDGMDCGECARTVERVVRKLDGVREVQVNFSTTKMSVVHSNDLAVIKKAVDQVGYQAHLLDTTREGAEVKRAGTMSEFTVHGMDCGECANTVKRVVGKVSGVEAVDVSFATTKMRVQHTGPVEAILRAVDQAGYRAELQGQEEGATHTLSAWERYRRTILTTISGVLLGVGFLVEYAGGSETVSLLLYLLSMLTGGFYAARAGYYAVKSLSLDMNFLMTVAAIGAAAIGQWSEGATVVFLFSVGNWLQAMTMERTRKSIRSLMNLTPKEALIRRDGRELKLPLPELRVGDTVIVRPGERLPMDGVVTFGQSTVNQAPITGESMPVTKREGDEVFAGTINETGSLEFRVTKKAEDSTLARIIHLVEEAQGQKAPSQQFVDRFAKYYTPVVVLLAVLIAVLPPLFGWGDFQTWIYRSLVLLVIACPCALVISTPVAIVAAIGNAAKQGVLIKGGAYLEALGEIDAVAFDKTGTLTVGRPQVVHVRTYDGITRDALLTFAAAVEARSEHPLARAILTEYEKISQEINTAVNFQTVTGRGAQADIDGITYRIGNPAWFTELGFNTLATRDDVLAQRSLGRTVMLVGDRRGILGLIAVADVVREESVDAVRCLKASGIEYTVMLTGDHERTAYAIAEQVGLDDYCGDLLPEQKLAKIRELKEGKHRVAMVGDGINDAPALATADIGIAMGGAGTDTALETADVVLMQDDLSKLPFTVRLSRKALAIIKRNIWFSLLVKVVFLLLTVVGYSNLWMAVFADTGAALIVILNGMRLMRTR
ncbi:MAG TPA: heavy metal translocating P-type ATPase [Bacilli bacterium]|nr:heavy metal translocating P-type ATPase [Bacilli bacterium]